MKAAREKLQGNLHETIDVFYTEMFQARIGSDDTFKIFREKLNQESIPSKAVIQK